MWPLILNVCIQLLQHATPLVFGANFGIDVDTCKYNQNKLPGCTKGFVVYGNKLQQGTAMFMSYGNLKSQ